jgi:hypothetical protein
MSIFFWKKNKVIDYFANDLANELYSSITPQMAIDYFNESSPAKKTRKIGERFEIHIQGIIKEIQRFKKINSLGVYGKARLHLKFMERLKELGYDANITKKINEYILINTP